MLQSRWTLRVQWTERLVTAALNRTRGCRSIANGKRLLHFLVRVGMIDAGDEDHASTDSQTSETNPRGAASLDFVLLLVVVLPIVALVLPLCRTAIQASFAWFSRVITCPFM